ncbi:hypothetical protein AXW37_04350 [Yersinia ruckeri]|nr:hypothetical protein AXW22_04345 [Yersinia ruckeri]OJB69599.1 hypothetical protein A9Q64_04355 [Yersinia ruckeri]OJB71419.1 hypothetical protein A9Q63_04355 [Yersinia ruckeri]OJB75815.1 hypothetical protein A9Q65_04350 [Yersinia ruckeri]OJB85592.1 hypothetical protein A9Q59_04380 [Yersinia ruckeri]
MTGALICILDSVIFNLMAHKAPFHVKDHQIEISRFSGFLRWLAKDKLNRRNPSPLNGERVCWARDTPDKLT